MSEVKEFRLPDVGEGLTEADIVAWHVKPGDRVTVNQVVVEIETAKAVVELPCPFEGVVTGLLVTEGDTVDVGTPIIAVDVSGAAAAATTAGAIGTPPAEGAVEPGLTGSPAPKAERQAVLVGYGVKLGPAKRRPRKAEAAAPRAPSQAPVPSQAPAPLRVTPAALAPSAPHAPQAHPAGPNGGRPAAKPPVRKLAKDLGVDLTRVTGTGPGGVITREDVQAAVPGAPAPAVPGSVAAVAGSGPSAADVLAGPPRQAGTGGPRQTRIPVKGVRKHTAAAVTGSAFTAPHVTEFLQADVTETMAALAELRGLPEFTGLRLSPLLLVAKALLVAVARHPMINSSWDEAAQEIVTKHYVNLGIAAATDRGLIVPNIKDAHALSLPDLARELAALAGTAREGRTQPAALAGGTITITNVGVFGVDAGTPILTPGEAAILAFGQIRAAPWVHEGELAVRQVTTLSLSFDHRIVDGDLGSAVLRDVAAMLTGPVRMLAWS